MEEEKYRFVLKEGMRVIFNFEDEKCRETILLSGQEIRKGKIYHIKKILSDKTIALKEFCTLTFSSRLFIPVCDTEGCNNPIFCADGLCENCYRKKIEEEMAKEKLKQ